MSTKKFNYCCINSNCTEKNNVVIEKDESLEEEQEICLECEQPLKLLGYIPYGGMAKFASMTPQQRSEVLAKRSKQHFEKGGGKEEKHEILKKSKMNSGY